MSGGRGSGKKGRQAPKPPSPAGAPAAIDLEPVELPDGGEQRELELEDALVEHAGRGQIAVLRAWVTDSELRGVGLDGSRLDQLLIRDSRLTRCDLSNVDARRGELRRIESSESKWIGFALIEGDVEDASFDGGSMMLASFAHSTLRRVRFRGVDLREAAFAGATLDSVVFEDCELRGADFRRAQLRNCVIRGCSLDGVVGVDSMRGLRMPWPELLDSTAALAAALGIEPEIDEEEDEEPGT